MYILIAAIVGLIYLVGTLLELGSMFTLFFVKKGGQLENIIASVGSALIAFGAGWFALSDIVNGNLKTSSYLLIIIFIVFSFNTYRRLSHYLLLKMTDGDRDNFG